MVLEDLSKPITLIVIGRSQKVKFILLFQVNSKVLKKKQLSRICLWILIKDFISTVNRFKFNIKDKKFTPYKHVQAESRLHICYIFLVFFQVVHVVFIKVCATFLPLLFLLICYLPCIYNTYNYVCMDFTWCIIMVGLTVF